MPAVRLCAALVGLLCGTAWARDPSAIDREATGLLEDGRFLEALTAFEELTVPGNPLPWRAKGHMRMGGIMALFLDQFSDAQRELRAAIELDPKGPIGADAHFQLGMILHELRRYGDAAAEFEAFLSIDAVSVNSPTAEFLLGQCRRLADRAPPAPPEPRPAEGFALADDHIRVAVLKNADTVMLGCAGAWACGTSRSGGREFEAGSLTVAAPGEEITIGSWRSGFSDLTFRSSGAELLTVNGSRLPGAVRVVAGKRKLLVINIVPLEDYLRGVVPREMPASWPASALQAQAVCARTYAVYHMLRRRDYDFDLLSTVSSQVYGGADQRDSRADSAVAKTRGRILLFQGEPALTLFHSSSGGHTEDMERVWGSGLPYLVAQEDPRSPPSEWTLTLSKDDAGAALAACGDAGKEVRSIEFLDKDRSGRFERVRITRSKEETVIRCDRFRGCIGPGTMKSTRMSVKAKGGQIIMEGTGFGHGVGLSQWGARGMAAQGAAVESILGFYYPGTTLGRLLVKGE